MPAIERVIPLVGQLPVAIRDALARRVRELAGLSLVALSAVFAAALMTWSVQDPSLSHATSRAIRNIAGYPGAICADLLMQILGLGAIMLILPLAVWGLRMLTHRSFDRQALRIACWVLCTVISAGFASCWPHGGAWPLPTGLGGGVGDALGRSAQWRARPPPAGRGRARGGRGGSSARRNIWPSRFPVSPRARQHPVRRGDRDLPDRERNRLRHGSGDDGHRRRCPVRTRRR